MSLLHVKGLTASYMIGNRKVRVLDGVTFDLKPSEKIAVVGESGSGKSSLALILARLNSDVLIVEDGEVIFRGFNILRLKESELTKLRGSDIAVVLQNPATALNPLYSVGDQISEVLRAHGYSKKEAFEEALKLLERVGMPEPTKTYRRYPHQLSGGQKQRVAIAIAIAMKPKLLIADEPTSALDVSTQARIIALLKKLVEEDKTSVIFITHDIGVAYDISDKILVMFKGNVVEIGPTKDVIREPLHPYTKHLISSAILNFNESSLMDTQTMEMRRNNEEIEDVDRGCPYAIRCPHKIKGLCDVEKPRNSLINNRSVSCHIYKDEGK